MKKSTLTLMVAMAVGLGGCSMFSSDKSTGINPGEVNAVKDERLSTDFKREGVRVTYTLLGNVDKIEAFGYAPVWRGNYEHVAEADAKDKLIKFLRGETVDTQRMTRVIARSIERAQDNTLNKFRTVDGSKNFAEEDLEKEPTNSEENNRSNTALRKTSVNNARNVTSTITVAARGRLNAVRLDRAGVVDDGRTYMAVYSWTPKNQDAARSITNMMDQR